MTQAEAAEHIYTHYRRASLTRGRIAGKPVRKFRRRIHHVKETKGKGKGKSCGLMWTHDDALHYLKGRG